MKRNARGLHLFYIRTSYMKRNRPYLATAFRLPLVLPIQLNVRRKRALSSLFLSVMFEEPCDVANTIFSQWESVARCTLLT